MPAGHDMSKMGASSSGSSAGGAAKTALGRQVDVDLGEFYVKPAS